MKKIIALAAAALLIAGCGSKDKAGQSNSAALGANQLIVTTAFTPDPPQKGTDTLTVTLKDVTGAAVKGAVVKLDSAMPLMSMSGPSVIARDNGDGSYTAHLVLKYATTWRFSISARRDGKRGASEVTADVK